MISNQTLKPFILLSKKTGLDVKSVSRTLPETLSMKEAATVDVVEVGKRDNPNQKITISTFRDAENNLIEMVHEYTNIDKPETHRVYNELPNYGDNSLKGRLIQLFENLDITGRFKAWQKIKSEKQYVKSTETGEKTHVTIAKVSTDERTISPVKKESHILTEYYVPKAHGGKKIPPKYIQFDTVKNENKIPEITTISSSKDVSIPQKDKYLAMRMYDSDDIRVPMTKTALEERNLKGLEIPIENGYRMGKTTRGQFNQTEGSIIFNSDYRNKCDIIRTGYHETEHAYQYAILAVTNKLDTPYAKQCRAKVKGTITPAIYKEAELYEEGDKNYILPSEDFDKYYDNILERYAREAGEDGAEWYRISGRELSGQFPRIPEEEL